MSSGVLCSYKFLSCLVTHIVGNFQGRKLLQISQLCGYLQKLSLQNWEHGVFWCRETEQSAKGFLCENGILTNLQSFLPQKFPAIRYANSDNIKGNMNSSIRFPCQQWN